MIGAVCGLVDVIRAIQELYPGVVCGLLVVVGALKFIPSTEGSMSLYLVIEIGQLTVVVIATT